MRAYFAMFLHLRDGKIVHQSDYDCFGPWRAAVFMVMLK